MKTNEVVIKGGMVEAIGGNDASGIAAKSVIIGIDEAKGEYVNADGAGFGAGITGSTITINGGRIEANGGNEGAAGIGGISDGNIKGSTDGAITISGGTVIANGGSKDGKGGAGIGGAYGNSNGAVTISGGAVTATGGKCAAGIGTGAMSDCKRDITIIGGTITTTGGTYNDYGGAGIGVGMNSKIAFMATRGDLEATITIMGDAVVTATGGGTNGYGAAADLQRHRPAAGASGRRPGRYAGIQYRQQGLVERRAHGAGRGQLYRHGLGAG